MASIEIRAKSTRVIAYANNEKKLFSLGKVTKKTAERFANNIDMLLNEKKFIGSFAGSCTPSRDFSKYVDWHRSGDLDLDALVTERYSIDDINEATTRLGNGLISGRAIIEF